MRREVEGSPPELVVPLRQWLSLYTAEVHGFLSVYPVGIFYSCSKMVLIVSFCRILKIYATANLFSLQNHVGCLFTDHDRRRIGIAGHDLRHDRRVSDA
jgi:hypothetical protein